MNVCVAFQLLFFLIRIHSLQGLIATTRHEVTRKKSTKRLKHTGNLFRKIMYRKFSAYFLLKAEKEFHEKNPANESVNYYSG